VFLERGYGATTVLAIAERADVSVEAIYKVVTTVRSKGEGPRRRSSDRTP